MSHIGKFASNLTSILLCGQNSNILFYSAYNSNIDYVLLSITRLWHDVLCPCYHPCKSRKRRLGQTMNSLPECKVRILN